MLQNFKYLGLFLRKSKNAFISFVSPELLDTVLKAKPVFEYSALDTKLGRLGIKIQTKYLRKLYATTLRNSGILSEIIDLVEGRIGKSVSIKSYYKPFLMDVRDRILRVVEPLQWELLYMLENHL